MYKKIDRKTNIPIGSKYSYLMYRTTINGLNRILTSPPERSTNCLYITLQLPTGSEAEKVQRPGLILRSAVVLHVNGLLEPFFCSKRKSLWLAIQTTQEEKVSVQPIKAAAVTYSKKWLLVLQSRQEL